jgi:hypothetical protein
MQGQHVGEDGAMSVVVKIVRTDQQRHFVACFGQQEQAANDRSFRLDAARWLAIQ